MELPKVTPVGLVEYPEGYSPRPHTISPVLRAVAGAVLVIFALAVVTTTVVSIGGYCLTSDAGDTRDLPMKPRR